MVRDYFLELFKSNCNDDAAQVLSHIPQYVSEDMNATLCKPADDKEIIEAFNNMDPRKAP